MATWRGALTGSGSAARVRPRDERSRSGTRPAGARCGRCAATTSAVLRVAWGLRFAASASSDYSSVVRVWDLAAPREHVPIADSAPGPVAWHRLGGLALTAPGGDVSFGTLPSARRSAGCTSRQGGPRPAQQVPTPGDLPTALALSPDGRALAVATYSLDSKDPRITIWDAPTRRVLGILRAGPRALGMGGIRVWSIALAPDGRYLASFHWDSSTKSGTWRTSER